jgi:N utilization substance protein A
VNAKGACIGPLGSRVRNVMAGLHGEKIDIVDFSDDPAEFVANALSPARVNQVEIVDAEARVAKVTVPDYQLSLAIGKEGQNARLAARLTGWRIDIRPDTPDTVATAGPGRAGRGPDLPGRGPAAGGGAPDRARRAADAVDSPRHPAGPAQRGPSADAAGSAEDFAGPAPGPADAPAR